MERLTRASDYRSEDVEVSSEGGTFRIRSVTEGGGFHEVNFSDPSCTCFDFKKSKLPCKHFAAVFLLVDGWGFSRLPVEYREGPNMTAHSVTSCTSADTEDPEVLADPITEEFQCSLQKTSEQSRRHLKSKIRAETNRLLSSLHYIHNDTVLQHLFGALHAARILAEENVTASSGIAVRGSPRKWCSGVTAKKRAQASPATGVAVKKLQLHNNHLPQKEHSVSRGRVGRKAEVMRECYKSPF